VTLTRRAATSDYSEPLMIIAFFMPLIMMIGIFHAADDHWTRIRRMMIPSRRCQCRRRLGQADHHDAPLSVATNQVMNSLSYHDNYSYSIEVSKSISGLMIISSNLNNNIK
jgi:hypothetical protein